MLAMAKGLRNQFLLKIQQVQKEEKIKKCSDDPKHCTIAQLCNMATTVKDGKRIWLKIDTKKYVKEAKKNGLTCSVENAGKKQEEIKK